MKGILNMRLDEKADNNVLKDCIIEDLEDLQNSALSTDNRRLFIQKTKKAEHKYLEKGEEDEEEEEEVEYNGQAIEEYLKQNIL